MASTASQRAAHRLLVERFLSQETFTLQELIDATGWTLRNTYGTYLSKHFRGLLENVAGGRFVSHTARYRVTEAFRQLLGWPKFRRHVTQVRRVVTDYEGETASVLIYDFLMPLTHETSLRTTLDALFVKDTLLAKLKTVNPTDLEPAFPRTPGQSDEDYFGIILSGIEKVFVGYSISHVDGRFRSGRVRSQDEIATYQNTGHRYLIDETTAVTRFIFPYGSEGELAQIEFLFKALFVRSIIQLVSEDEIWMLESGPHGQVVHKWRAAGDDDEDADDEEE